MINNIFSFSTILNSLSMSVCRRPIRQLLRKNDACLVGIDNFRPVSTGSKKDLTSENLGFGVKKSLGAALLLSTFFVSYPTLAHRGASDEIDTCQIQVGFEKVHFTAYTPTFTQNEEYCRSIPNIGPTNLVFDYEGKSLRNISVEFEVTKEPEGTRVFYQEPKKIKTGTVNGLVDFSQYGKGKYLAHVTIVHEGKTLDTHLPFWVGVKAESDGFLSDPMFGKLLLTFTILLALTYFLIQLYKSKGEEETSANESKSE